MLDLSAIKQRRNQDYSPLPFTLALRDIDTLLLEVEWLRNENEKLSEAIREYNDAELYYAHKDED